MLDGLAEIGLTRLPHYSASRGWFETIPIGTWRAFLDAAQIARDLDLDYEAVLNFLHKVQDVSGDIDEFDLYDVCEADEIYVTAGEKGLEDEESSPRQRGL